MDEWIVSILLGVWNGGGVCCCCPAQCSVCGSCPTHPIAVLASTAVMLCTASCRVRGVWVVSVCVCCSCCGVSSVCSPLVVVVGGAIVDGGWHSGGRAAVLLTPRRMSVSPSVCRCPRLCVGVPLVVYPVALLNGGWGVCCAALSSDWAGTLALFYFLSYCSVPLLSLCLLSQHCWFGCVSL